MNLTRISAYAFIFATGELVGTLTHVRPWSSGGAAIAFLTIAVLCDIKEARSDR